jgi:hypothetical protein
LQAAHIVAGRFASKETLGRPRGKATSMVSLEDRLKRLEQITRMAALEDRLLRLEHDVNRLSPTVGERLERLETMVGARPAPAAPPATLSKRFAAALSRFGAWLGPELPKFLLGALALLLAYWIKDSVDLAVKERQVDLSYAKEMQSLLQKMSDPQAEMSQLESSAIVLASYGRAALPALLSELRFNDLRANAAEVGLQSLALTDADSVCQVLPRLLDERGKLYDWDVHLKVVRLLGDNHCQVAIEPLRNYRVIVAAAEKGDATRFQQIVRQGPAAPAEDYPRLLSAVDRSLQTLESSASKSAWWRRP